MLLLSQFIQPRDHRLVSLASVSDKVTESRSSWKLCEGMWKTEVTGNSTHHFTEGKSCLMNFGAFFNRGTSLGE